MYEANMNNKHIGSNFDDFLKDEDLLDEVTTTAIKRVISYQLKKAMEERKLTKQKLADMMSTSRSSLDRLLNPQNTSITLKTLGKAAHALGEKIVVDLR
jgi:DNA-binding Xre family transcriptional regulator